MNLRKLGVMSIVVFLSLIRAYGNQSAQTIDHEGLSSRTYKTWLGVFAFSEDKILSIEGLEDLHVLVYRCPGKEGTLIDFASPNEDGTLRLLRTADSRIQDAIYTFEGVDVLPGTNEAEVIVRWRIPGQGGLRSVEKYRYNSSDLELVARSEFVSDGRKMKWIKGRPSVPSTPARLSPR